MAGCVPQDGGSALLADPAHTGQDASATDDPGNAALTATYVLSGAYLEDWQPALRNDTAISEVALEANRMSIDRSPTLFLLRAAEAESAAEKAAWFPRIRPTASLGVGSTGPGIGISVTQMIYDFSQTRTRREKAEISRAMTEIQFWKERNEDVRDALLSYVDAVEANEVIAARQDLEQRLMELAMQEADRVQSGVTGQGDTLFLDVSRQENRRDMIRQRAKLTDARARLLRDAGVRLDQAPQLRFAALSGACQAPQERDHAPDLLRARLAVELATMSELEARKNLFPRIVAAADLTTGTGGSPEDNARIAFEGGSIAGGGARLRIEAERQRTLAAERGFTTARHDLARELERLEIDTHALRNTLREYGELVQTTDRSLALFKDRFLAGAASVAEAVRLEVERSANLVAIAETRGAIERNCVEAARLYGALSAADIDLE
jgi:outer membrane protein TolC